MMYADDILDRTKKQPEPMTISSISEGTITGAVIGLVGGIFFAYYKDKRYVPCMIGGTIAGGLVSRLLIIKK